MPRPVVEYDEDLEDYKAVSWDNTDDVEQEEVHNTRTNNDDDDDDYDDYSLINPGQRHNNDD